MEGIYKNLKTVSFVVLALNEEDHIKNTIATVLTAASGSSMDDFEIIMVDDGSTDSTGAIMDKLCLNNIRLKVIHNHSNLGLGAAYLNGVQDASMEYIMIIAGDNIMPQESITEIVNNVGHVDIILPYMTDAKYREPIRRYGSLGFTCLINLMSGLNIKYYNGMVVRKRLFEGEKIQSTGYSIMAECVLKFIAKGATYYEIGVPHGYPNLSKSGSKALRINNLMNLVGSIFRIYQTLRQTKKH